MDLRKLNSELPGYVKRISMKQKPTEYRLYIYVEEITNLTKGTKKKAAITSSKFKRVNDKKGYKNIQWLNKMYDRKLKEAGEEGDNYYKIILPMSLPKGYKLFDKQGEYYGTVVEEDDVFYYVVIGKRDTVDSFEKDFVERMFIQGQCNGKYGFSIPLEFLEGFERKG